MSMSSPEIDPAILATLTDAERASLTDDDDMTPEERAAMQDTGDDGEAGDAETEAGESAEETEQADDNQAAAEEATEDSEFRPRYEADLPEDFDAQMQALKTERAGIIQKFKDGDLDADEYADAIEANSSQRDDLSIARTKAELSADMRAQSSAQEWEWTMRRFSTAEKKRGGIDYFDDAGKRNDLETFVRALAGVPSNQDKDFDWFISEGHKRVMALHGLNGRIDAAVDPKDRGRARKPPVSDIPKTLAQVPGGDGPGDVASEFAGLDSLSGLEAERAMAKMSPDQLARYLKAA
jgi:hypothetical protein